MHCNGIASLHILFNMFTYFTDSIAFDATGVL